MEPIGNAESNYSNPLVDLPFPADSVLENIDAILLTHTHRDHFDEKAIKTIPKNIPIFCQPADEYRLFSLAFLNVQKVDSDVVWKGIQIIRTEGQHGTGDLGKQMAPVSGFILKAGNEPSIYIAGDTIMCPAVVKGISKHSPKIIILNGGEAQFLTGDPITMGPIDIQKVSELAPYATILFTHMEAWNHCLLTRQELQQFIHLNQLFNVKVPNDGEVIEY